MLELFMGLAMLVSGSFGNYATAVTPGEYYEFVVAPQCQNDRTWTVGAKYKVEANGSVQKQHLQVRSLKGCVDTKAFINEAVVDPNITVVGR